MEAEDRQQRNELSPISEERVIHSRRCRGGGLCGQRDAQAGTVLGSASGLWGLWAKPALSQPPSLAGRSCCSL